MHHWPAGLCLLFSYTHFGKKNGITSGKDTAKCLMYPCGICSKVTQNLIIVAYKQFCIAITPHKTNSALNYRFELYPYEITWLNENKNKYTAYYDVVTHPPWIIVRTGINSIALGHKLHLLHIWYVFESWRWNCISTSNLFMKYHPNASKIHQKYNMYKFPSHPITYIL